MSTRGGSSRSQKACGLGIVEEMGGHQLSARIELDPAGDALAVGVRARHAESMRDPSVPLGVGHREHDVVAREDHQRPHCTREATARRLRNGAWILT